MTLIISSAFDAGNIRVVKQSGDTVDLEIVKDHMSRLLPVVPFPRRRRRGPRS